MRKYLSFVGSNWKFVPGYIQNVDTHLESFRSKKQVIKKLSPKGLWQTYMKWTVLQFLNEYLTNLQAILFIQGASSAPMLLWMRLSTLPRTLFISSPVTMETALCLQKAKYMSIVTLSLSNKLSSAKFLVCFNFQSASMSLIVGENFVRVSNSLDSGETQSYSASHPDPSCLHIALYLCLAG